MLVGGGGGYEIENKIDVYQLADPGREKILKNLVHSEGTGTRVGNYFELGSQGLNILAACLTERVAIYKIEIQTG